MKLTSKEYLFINWSAISKFLLEDAQSDFNGWEILRSFYLKEDDGKCLWFLQKRFNKYVREPDITVEFENKDKKVADLLYGFLKLPLNKNIYDFVSEEELMSFFDSIDFVAIASMYQFGLNPHSIKRALFETYIPRENVEKIILFFLNDKGMALTREQTVKRMILNYSEALAVKLETLNILDIEEFNRKKEDLLKSDFHKVDDIISLDKAIKKLEEELGSTKWLEAVEHMANTKMDNEFGNTRIEYVSFVLIKLINNSKKRFVIFEDDFNHYIFNNAVLEALSSFLEKGEVIVFSSERKSLHFNTFLIKNRRDNLKEIKMTDNIIKNLKELFKDEKIYHFCVSDNSGFKLDMDENTHKFICNFNDPVLVKKLLKALDLS
jgi:hypothetical protein